MSRWMGGWGAATGLLFIGRKQTISMGNLIVGYLYFHAATNMSNADWKVSSWSKGNDWSVEGIPESSEVCSAPCACFLEGCGFSSLFKFGFTVGSTLRACFLEGCGCSSLFEFCFTVRFKQRLDVPRLSQRS